MSDVLTITDLETAKKHDTFHSEVITGKAGGLSTGADIDTATNAATGQVQKTLPKVLRDLGMMVQTWTATAGGTLTDASQVFLNDITASAGKGNYYAWTGAFPKVVAPGTDPASVAGFVLRSDVSLRGEVDKTRFSTLSKLISLDSYSGVVDAESISGMVVTTDWHNTSILNTSHGGGARYVIQPAASYGVTPDGSTVNGILAGADHYIGGGTDWVAKYIPNKDGSVDAEALGLYQGQAIADSTTVFEKIFNYCGLKNPIKSGHSRTIDLPAKTFSYDNQFQGIDIGILNINIRGAKMPEVLDDLSALKNGTIIKGRMALQVRSGDFSNFGIDGGTVATGSWPYNWDAFKCFTDTQAYAGRVSLYRVIGLGRDYNQTSHAIVLAGYKRSIVRDCQGYNTWYGLSVDFLSSVIDGFIGGNVYRNVVNVKSHPNATQASSNKDVTISNVTGFGTTNAGANVGVSIVAVETDGGIIERCAINNIVGNTAQSLVTVTPFNGGVVTNLVISNLSGSNFDQPAINIFAGSGGGAIYDVSLNNITLANVKHKAAYIANTRFLSIDRLFASKGSAANPYFNANFVEIDSTVIAPELSRITLTDQFNTSSFAGAVLWNNTDATKARRSMMRCVELGVGKPATLG